MGRFLIQSVLSFLIAMTMIACTSSDNEESTNSEVLNSNSVFNESQSSYSSNDILAFDEQNRPVLSGTKLNCDDPTTPPSCETGFKYDETSNTCVTICKEGQVFAQGQCYDRVKTCDLENGNGTQSWMANSYGECTVATCNDGYEISGNSCVAKCTNDEVYHNGECKPLIADCKENGKEGSMVWQDAGYGKCHTSRNCKMPDGKGIQRWIPQTLLYDRCEVVSCNSGYKKQGNKCVSRCTDNQIFNGKKCLPIVKECRIAGGKGSKKWRHWKKKYSHCRVVSCNRGFIRRGNSCVRPRPRGDRECDPLVVDMGSDINNAQGITLSSQPDGILFDILGLNSTPKAHDKKQISWTQQERYQFVVRPNAQGQVHGIEQMFGDNTMGPDGKFSADGFEAIGKFDIDKNGSIDPDDPIYFELALWSDTNGNGKSDLGELTSFTAAGISSIDLNFDPNFFEVDQYGNKTTYKSVVNFNDGHKSLIFDLWFKYFEPKTEDPNQCPAEENDGKVATNL